jgi:hypothetical protein
MPLFLERYTIPHDLPEQDLVYGMRKVKRGSDATPLRCAYSLSDGVAWCITEAPSAEAVRRGFERIEFPFKLDSVEPAASTDVLERLPHRDGIFDPRETSPSEVGGRT